VDNQVVFMVVGIILLGALMIWPQWQARRRRQKQLAAMDVGDEVVTIGGIIGRLTYISAEEDRARIEIAPGVEMQVLLSAVNRPLASP
jgi:preprotein translocase subunit YajC